MLFDCVIRLLNSFVFDRDFGLEGFLRIAHFELKCAILDSLGFVLSLHFGFKLFDDVILCGHLGGLSLALSIMSFFGDITSQILLYFGHNSTISVAFTVFDVSSFSLVGNLLSK